MQDCIFLRYILCVALFSYDCLAPLLGEGVLDVSLGDGTKDSLMPSNEALTDKMPFGFLGETSSGFHSQGELLSLQERKPIQVGGFAMSRAVSIMTF